MSIEITWLGHASFRLAGAGCVVYIDPWKLTAAPHDADVVFVSHSHYDHLSPSDVQRVSKDGTTVLAPADAVASLPGATPVQPGQSIRIGELQVDTTWAYNVGKAYHPKSKNWCGAVFTLAGVRIYYAGDTDRTAEMASLHDVDVALLPVGGTYTLNADEAAGVCKTLAPRRAIPYHWGDVVGEAQDAKRFAQKAGVTVSVMTPGETITV